MIQIKCLNKEYDLFLIIEDGNKKETIFFGNPTPNSMQNIGFFGGESFHDSATINFTKSDAKITIFATKYEQAIIPASVKMEDISISIKIGSRYFTWDSIEITEHPEYGNALLFGTLTINKSTGVVSEEKNMKYFQLKNLNPEKILVSIDEQFKIIEESNIVEIEQQEENKDIQN